MSSEPKVELGQRWIDTETGRTYRVAELNYSTEAGTDSWKMLVCDQFKGRRVLYMHHNARVRGDWLRSPNV